MRALQQVPQSEMTVSRSESTDAFIKAFYRKAAASKPTNQSVTLRNHEIQLEVHVCIFARWWAEAEKLFMAAVT